MAIDRVHTHVDIPADMSSREAQAEILYNVTRALGVLVSAAGLRGLQITCENPGDGSNLEILVTPSEAPEDAVILQQIGSRVEGVHPMPQSAEPSGRLH